MKKTLFIALGLLTIGITAQVPRLSLYESYTGETCPICPPYNSGVDAIMSASNNTPNVVCIKWMAPIPSAPSPTWSLFKTNMVEINWRWSPGGYAYPTQNTPTSTVGNGINSVPSGKMDGQDVWRFGATSNHPTYLTDAVIDSAHSFMSPFSVTMQKSWDQAMTAMTLTVTIVAAENFTANGALVFRAVMIEKTVQFTVSPGNNNEYIFRNPVIKSFPTLQAGTSLAATWTTGQTYSFTLNCPVPSYRRDINEVDMVGFIQDDGNKKVVQAVRAADCVFNTITIAGPQQEVCTGQPVTLTASGSGSYLWSDGQIGTSIVVTPTASINYWVRSYSANFCSNVAAIGLKVAACTGLNEGNGNTSSFDLYPNPGKGEFTVKTKYPGAATLLIIYDALGTKVFEQSLQSHETVIRSNLPGGIYSYIVRQSEQFMNSGRLVIE